jgi:nucleotide-binding universal stress UspA family protein
MLTIRKILCPIDFSGTSRRAFDYALALARWHRASVSVLHVHQLATPVYASSSIGPEAFVPIRLTELEQQQLLATLNEYVAVDREAGGVSIDTILDESLDVTGAILTHAASIHADLIALGTHGRSGFQRLVLGSVAEKTLRRAGCPVLTVPPHTPDAVPRQLAAIQRILCPVDFSRSSMRALAYGASLAQETGARLTILHVVELPPDLSEPPNPALADYVTSVHEQARYQMREAIGTTVPATCTTEVLHLTGNADREILRVANEREADLIAMGVHGRGAMDLLFFGSTTSHVIREAICPVLTLRSEADMIRS